MGKTVGRRMRPNDEVNDVKLMLAAREGQKAARLERAFRLASSCSVHRAVAGDSALRALETHSFDLIVIDSKLEVVRAPELCRILRGRQATANIPLVMVEFDSPDAYDRARASVSGADDYVDGRTPNLAVVERIQSAVARRKAISRPGSVHEYNDGRLRADFVDMHVTVDGNTVVLRRREFEFLKYLIERKNRVVTRQDLFEDVWSGRGTVDNHTIDVHLCRLRRKLGPAGGQIQTLVSIGYRFVDGAHTPAK
jgi:DNA-binding response OmpR family regulator